MPLGANGGRATRSGMVLGAAIAVCSAHARAAGSLEVVPVEGGTWPSQIAALEAAASPGHAGFHVRVVEDDTTRALACGQYTLQLDPRGAQALQVGACDPSTAATEIILVDRSAMFAPGNPVAVPMPVEVRAYGMRLGSASGGAGLAGGVEFRCTASVRPYVADLLDGHMVFLTPDRYALEPLDVRVHAAVGRDGWVISSREGSGSTDAAFRIVDVHDGREIVRRRVAMQCAVSAETEQAAVSPERVRAPLRLPPGAVGRGMTDGGAPDRLECTQSEAPTVVWRYTAPRDGTYEFLLQGGYQTALEVRRAGADARPLGCSHDARIATHARVVARLAGGEQYDLLVSGEDGESGEYDVAVIPIQLDVVIDASAR